MAVWSRAPVESRGKSTGGRSGCEAPNADKTFFVKIYYFVTISRSLYTFARQSVVCRLSVARLSSVTFMRPTQAAQIFGNISTALGTLTIL